MISISNYWKQQVELEVLKTLRNAPHEKGSGKIHEKVRAQDHFPKYKPGEGGFTMGKDGKKGSNRDASSDDE